ADIKILEDHHYYRDAAEEMVWLRRVASFYQRYPEYEDRIKPHFEMVLRSDDPQVKEALYSGVLFGEIWLPLDDVLADKDWSDEDRQVIDYLQHCSFSLPARMRGVQ